MAENMIKFYRGSLANLPATGVNGSLYITTDEGAIYYGTGTGMKRLGDFIQVDAVANLPTAGANVSALYYCVAENILAKWDGSEWTQINKQPTADQIKTMIGLADYETKTDAAQKLTDAKAYTDTEVAKVQGEVDALETLVGTIPETATATDIVGYVQEKTAGIATDTALEELTGRVADNEADIKALQEANAEGGAVANAIADAKQAGTDAHAAAEAADAKAVAAQGEVDALETVVSDYKTANDAAVKAADDAAKAAQADIDALEAKVGEVPEGETVVSMIEDAQTLAGDAMKEAEKKVASVTAGDASITVAGTATAPTVAAKLSADADNALELAADGLKVVIPAAAEYVIEKAEESGEYAAIYKLMKNGVQAGASINIPKDMVVESGSVVDDPEGQPAGTYIKLVLQNVAEPLYINVGSLIEYVTSGSQTGDMVVINVSDDHKVTATITDGTVGIEKLTTDVQTKINKAHSHENADVLAGITADQVAAWDKAEENATKAATDLNTAMNTRVEALEAIDHEHANKDLLDTYTQTEANLADAVAKKHEHANASELAKIAEGDVEKWNGAEQNAKDYTDALANGQVKTNTEAIATKAAQADLEALDTRVGTAEGKIADLETASATHALKSEVEALANGAVADNAAAIAKNAEDIATKANAADVYAKTETYTQEEVDTAIEDALTAAMSWGSF